MPDLERLVVSLEASITKYEKTLAKAVGVSDKQARAVESRWAKLNIGGGVFTSFAKGALAALAPTLILAVAVRQTKEALKEFGDVADRSAAAGLDPELFQSLAYQFQLVGVEAEQSASALATFAKNSGLAVEGKGKMVGALKALDSELLENIRNARNQEERIRLVADALAKTEDPARRAAIATAAFGEAGSRIASALADGASSIDTMMVKARQLGLIVDRDLIAKADELGDSFDTASKVVDLKLKQAFINLGPVLLWLSGLAADFTSQIGQTVDRLSHGVGDQMTSTLEARLAGLQTALDSADPMQSPNLAQVASVNPDEAKAEQAAILAELRRRAIASLTSQLSNRPPTSEPLPTIDEEAAGVKSHNQAAQAAIQHANAIKDLIGDLKSEGEQIGATALQQQILANLHRVSADAASDEGQQIAALVTANYQHEQSIDRVTAAYNEFQNIAERAGDTFIDKLQEGKTVGDALLATVNDLVAQLPRLALQAAIGGLFGSGPGAGGGGLLSGLFGGFMASGGPVVPGRSYMVGEQGPELFVPKMPGTIVPNGGGNGGGALMVRVVTEVREGNLVPVMTQVSGQVGGRMIKQYDSGLPGRQVEKGLRYG